MTGNGQVKKIILASASTARRNLLAAAGIEFEVQPADIDEAAVRAALSPGGQAMPPLDIALILAEAKAGNVALQNPDALVIGSDQILALGDGIFSKPRSIADAHRQLGKLRGRTHHLHAGVCCVSADQTLWRYGETASLTMRDFSDDFRQVYLNREGEKVCASVGAYQLEGRGVQLFEKIEGDYFTILGLPLLPLLEFLRLQGAIEA